MFLHSKYSSYSLEQIISESVEYEQTCQKILEMTNDETIKEKIKNILYEGGFDDFTINTPMINSNSPYIEADRRLHFAYLLANHPDTFEKMVKHNIILFHGTRIEALPNILKYGINSVDTSAEKGIKITTGEDSSRINGKRSFISFTNSIDIATRYALSRKGNNQNNSFGIMIGMSTESLQYLNTCTVLSNDPEIGINDHIPIEHIKMLAVPPNKIAFVKKIVGDMPIEVMSMNIKDKFYRMDTLEMSRRFEINKEMQLTETESSQEYKQNDVKNFVKGRKLSRLLDWITKLTEKNIDEGGKYEILDR